MMNRFQKLVSLWFQLQPAPLQHGAENNVSHSAVFDAAIAKKPNSVAALIRAVRPNYEDSEKMITLEVGPVKQLWPRHQTCVTPSFLELNGIQ